MAERWARKGAPAGMEKRLEVAQRELFASGEYWSRPRYFFFFFTAAAAVMSSVETRRPRPECFAAARNDGGGAASIGHLGCRRKEGALFGVGRPPPFPSWPLATAIHAAKLADGRQLFGGRVRRKTDGANQLDAARAIAVLGLKVEPPRGRFANLDPPLGDGFCPQLATVVA